MKNRAKKSISLLLAVIMLLCAVPMTGSAASITVSGRDGNITISNTSTSYLNKVSAFLSDSRWKHGTSWGSRGPKLSSWGSSGCCAYAADFSKYVFGVDSPNGKTQYTGVNNIQSGDILYFSQYPHYVVVLQRNGNTLITAEANVGSDRGVRVSNSVYSISGSTIYQFGSSYSTSVRIGRYDNVGGDTGTHTHSYYRGVEAAHPHKVYMKCSCGDSYYTGATQYVDSCDECWDLNRVDVWVSNVNQTAEINEGIVQNQYQFWFKFANKDTGALYNSYGSTRGYNAKISVYNPDGSELFSYTYNDSDYNWIRATPTQMGDYKVRITLTGNITADYWEYFTVKSDAELHFDETTILTIVEGQSKSFKAWITGKLPDGSTLHESINTKIATVKWDKNTVTITGVKSGFTIYKLDVLDVNQNVVASESRWIKVVPASYTVTYNANGGSGAPSNQTKTYGQTLTLSTTKPIKSGYTFKSWNTKADGSGTTYSSGASYTANANVTLYAQWKANTYTVTYNANGGSGTPSNQTKTYGQTLTLLSTKPTRGGYTFKSWNTKADGSGTTYLPGASYTANANVTLYAQWKANTYTLYFDANGGSGAPQSMTGGTSYTIPSTIPKRFSYNFKGWQYLNDSGSYSYYNPGDKITITKNTTLTASWVGSSFSSAGRTVYSHIVYPGEIYYNKYTPTATGKYVIYSYGDDDTYGYLYDSKGNILASNDDGGEGRNFRIEYTLTAGTTYYFGVKYYSSSKTGTINSKFGLVYTVSYNANRGSGAPSSQSKDWGKNLTLSSTVPTRIGYTFLGWSTSSSATSVTYKAGAVYSANNNVTLYAVWKSNPCSHSYDSGKITTAATCNSTGVKTYTCTVCKATKTETLPKNPSNHAGGTAVKNALAATCIAKGYTGDTYCLGCGVITLKGKEIAATGHTDTNNDGKCDVCGTAVGTPSEPEKPDTPSETCNHICHKSGIARFFYLIARLFWKMFKTNKYCSCGAAHY